MDEDDRMMERFMKRLQDKIDKRNERETKAAVNAALQLIIDDARAEKLEKKSEQGE
jgi:hypothetical protein